MLTLETSDERKSKYGWVIEAVQLPLPSASGKEREEPQIFSANNLFHILVEKPLEMYPRLCWHCRSGLFIEVSESTSELGPGNWGELDGGEQAANRQCKEQGSQGTEWVCPTVNLCKSNFNSDPFLLMI